MAMLPLVPASLADTMKRNDSLIAGKIEGLQLKHCMWGRIQDWRDVLASH
jgi:hypothetical protein